MTYSFRIQVADDYLGAIWRASYNFAYLEWTIICTGKKLKSGFIRSAEGNTAGANAKEFKKLVQNTSFSDPAIQARLSDLADNFENLVPRRNQLLHGTPMSAPGGEQRLKYMGKHGEQEWTIPLILDAAKDFETAAIEASALLHMPLP